MLQENGPKVDALYADLDVETRIVVQQRTSEIKTLMRRTAQDIVDIGLKLIEVKSWLRHGLFYAWLRAEFEWSESTAVKFMQVAERFKSVNFTDLQRRWLTNSAIVTAGQFLPKKSILLLAMPTAHPLMGINCLDVGHATDQDIAAEVARTRNASDRWREAYALLVPKYQSGGLIIRHLRSGLLACRGTARTVECCVLFERKW